MNKDFATANVAVGRCKWQPRPPNTVHYFFPDSAKTPCVLPFSEITATLSGFFPAGIFPVRPGENFPHELSFFSCAPGYFLCPYFLRLRPSSRSAIIMMIFPTRKVFLAFVWSVIRWVRHAGGRHILPRRRENWNYLFQTGLRKKRKRGKISFPGLSGGKS